jgi:sigma-B regulation protein RsbU (phosphoserine phosphatase)
MMPGMSGLDVLKFLRRIDSLLDLPIIMVTAKGESEDMVEALELGANDYVTKPFDFSVVLARIRSQLTLKRAVSQVTELERKLEARNKELEAASAELTVANRRMKVDLEAAAQVRQALLPTLPAELPEARFARVFQPCRALAGDLLDVFPLDERHLGLCVLDANGQGVDAALLAVAGGHLLLRMSGPPWPGTPRPTLVSPAHIAAQLSKHFSAELAEESARLSCTLLYGVLALDTREFRFISAGHPGPVHLPQGGSATLLEVTGLPVGVGSANYREMVVKLEPGERLFLYSDGVTQARNPDGEHLGSRRLLSTLEETRRLSLEASLENLLRRVEEWCGDAPRRDDLSILAVEMTDHSPSSRGTSEGKSP